jgi:YfiH family protein
MFEGKKLDDLSCIISSRSAGNMVYSENGPGPERLKLYGELGLESRNVRGLHQVHSRNVLFVDDEHNDLPDNKPALPDADGLITKDKSCVLSVMVADCLPVLLYDTVSGCFSLLHSGWKGTGIALKALALMAEYASVQPETVAAVLGPCIGVCCYRVDEERLALFVAEFGKGGSIEGFFKKGAADLFPLGPVVRRDTIEAGGGCFLDLKAANARILAGAGVRNISYCEDCTFTDERLGSFRREGQAYTHMAVLAGYFGQ